MIWKAALVLLILIAISMVSINFTFNVLVQHVQQRHFISNAIFTLTGAVVEPNGDPIDDVEMPG